MSTPLSDSVRSQHSTQRKTQKRGLSLADLFSQNQKQIEAWDAQLSHRFLLYGGAAGGGKSFFLRWWAVAYLISLAQHGITGASVGLFCEDYPSLQDRQISKIEAEFPASLGKLRQGETRDFVLHRKFGGGRILLRNLDKPSKYLSAEFAGIGVDELTRNDQDVFDFLRMRLRWPGVPFPRFVGTTNPGGRGHGWVKSLWINRQFPPELQALADEFVFVQAKASDNPFLTETYHTDLLTLPLAKRRAYAEGSWDIFAGQYFDIFSTRHVLPADQVAQTLKPWWPRWISMDWGYDHPSAVYWHAKDGDRIITYRELVRNKTGETDLAASIVRMSKGEKINALYLDPSCFAKRGDAHTVADQIGDVLADHDMPRPSRADNDRIGGARLMHELMSADLWQISDACPRLIECLPTLIHDEDDVEDVLKVNAGEGVIGDDPYDAARYGLKSMLNQGKQPWEEKYREALSIIPDAHNRAMLSLRMVADHAKRGRMDGFVPGRMRWNKRPN